MKLMIKPLILIYIHKLPYPYTTGTNQRIKSLVSYLRQYYQIGLIIPKYTPDINQLRCDYDYIWYGGHYNTFFQKIKWKITGFLKKKILIKRLELVADDFSNSLNKFSTQGAWRLEEICRKHNPNLIIIQKIFNTVPAAKIAKKHNIPVFLDTHDVFYLSKSNNYSLTLQEKGIHKASSKEEISLLQQFDALIAIQHDDAKLLRHNLPNIPTVVAMHPVTVGNYELSYQTPPHTDLNILFVGSSAIHNVEAIQFFIKSIFPKIIKIYPNLKLEICGSCVNEIQTTSPNIILTGVVDDLLPYYKKATIVINPIIQGSGLKIKTVEAMSYGKCLVTTTIGIEGLLNVENSAVITHLESMDKAIIELFNMPESILSYEKAALKYGKRYFTPEACYDELHQTINTLLLSK